MNCPPSLVPYPSFSSLVSGLGSVLSARLGGYFRLSCVRLFILFFSAWKSNSGRASDMLLIFYISCVWKGGFWWRIKKNAK